jgi:hypothetical protein
MSTQQSYKNLLTLSKSITTAIEKLDSGTLNISEIQEVLADARELHERIAILQYVLHSKNTNGSFANDEPIEIKSNKSVEKDKAASSLDSKISESLDIEKQEPAPKEKKGFKLNFNLFTPEPEPTNQINLLDVIEEEAPVVESPKAELSKTEVVVEVEVKETKVVEENSSMNKVIAKVSEKQALSLNEKLADLNEKPTLAAKLSRKPVKDLNEEIGLNQKFLFMNDLFGGENTLYKEAIASINGFNSADEAKQLLSQLAQRHNWDMESTSVLKFTDLVERKFLS